MLEAIFKIKEFILDTIFPKYCVGCGLEGIWLCQKCKSKIIHIKSPTCPYCKRLTKIGQVCPRCRKKSNLNGVIIAAYYEDGPLKEAIHTFKYDGVFDLKKDLGEILVESLKKRNIKTNFVVISVPLHKYRLAQRGYNQAELLASLLAKSFNYKIIKNKLKRNKNKAPQITLSKKDRIENVKGIFGWIGDNKEIKNKKIILVDDVFTTGSTLEECARVLRSNGAREVWGLVLAKA